VGGVRNQRGKAETTLQTRNYGVFGFAQVVAECARVPGITRSPPRRNNFEMAQSGGFP
jgi:hypothetical protein